MSYPNLNTLITHHPYSMDTFADHANVTMEVLRGALSGNDLLTDAELCGMAFLAKIPTSVIKCPRLIMLDPKREKHRRMIKDLERDEVALINEVLRMADKEVFRYMDSFAYEVGQFTRSFLEKGIPVSYAAYIGWNAKIIDCAIFAEHKKSKKSKRSERLFTQISTAKPGCAADAREGGAA